MKTTSYQLCTTAQVILLNLLIDETHNVSNCCMHLNSLTVMVMDEQHFVLQQQKKVLNIQAE